MATKAMHGAEARRLEEDALRQANWKRWGPYLSERQWATVREDYSASGNPWNDFPHDHARSRAYRWGEDGLLGITDRECRLCFALALWNEQDPFLKERLFGLTGPEGNHGEDVKECYYYLDSTPTHSYMRALYQYPQARFPYEALVEENRRRGRQQPEYELTDTGVFAGGRYFDVQAEYAKAGPDDLLISITVSNRGLQEAMLHLLPTLWFRNTWIWGCLHEGCWTKPHFQLSDDSMLLGNHATLGRFRFAADLASDGTGYEWLFTDNETNTQRLYGSPNESRYVKDAFHRYVIGGETTAVNPRKLGTKAAAHYELKIPAQSQVEVRLRFCKETEQPAKQLASELTMFGPKFGRILAGRKQECDEFYAQTIPAELNSQEQLVARQSYAGLLWSKQFYHYVVEDWLTGDPNLPPPPESRKAGRNADWRHVFNRDILSMPDKWEYPWFAAWDLAFHTIPLARLDPVFAKDQLTLLLREWYMHPNGQIPAYEFDFGDVNPPVHAWACWRVYKMAAPRGQRDWRFLSSAFQKLLINFTWWVNRKDTRGKHLFSGGFLGLDNIGVFDRSRPLPNGGLLEQADGTSWMGFYCATMLAMALELSRFDPAAEDIASKFFEHFVYIADAINTIGGTGLWDEEDGFYYDQMYVNGRHTPLRVRSMVGLIPLFTVQVLTDEFMAGLPGFQKRLNWFLTYRRDLAQHISYMECQDSNGSHGCHLLAIPSRQRLERVLRYVLDENEFLSPYGIRSLSKYHRDHPYVFRCNGEEHRVEYVPGESNTGLFGGNSNWRGPIWFPVNYLLIEALERYHYFYGDSFKVECPTGSGQWMNLAEVAQNLASRLVKLFLLNQYNRRPYQGEVSNQLEPGNKDMLLFHEYFHGDTGAGLGACHQTGWTSLIADCLWKTIRNQVTHER